MTHFILCSGLARHGKDLSAEILKEEFESRGEKVLVTHYADLLKFICKNFLGWNGEKDEAGRTLLQQVGTDVIRAKNPDYWVDFIGNLVQMLPEDTYSYIIISDVRFPNEINRIKEMGFSASHVRIFRPDFENNLTEEQKNHPSETALSNFPTDFFIKNTTISALKEQLSRVCDDILSQKTKGEKR